MNIKFSTEVYDALKKLAQIWLPAAGALYFALAGIWHLPNSEQVTGSVVALDTFLGVVLGLSSAAYQGDGVINVDNSDPSRTTFSLELNSDPIDLQNAKQATFMINPAVPPAPPGASVAENAMDPRLVQK